jgi:hypothetical protein
VELEDRSLDVREVDGRAGTRFPHFDAIQHYPGSGLTVRAGQ